MPKEQHLTLKIRKGRSGPIFFRHPWVFGGALLDRPEGVEPGTPVRLIEEDGRFLAMGYFSGYSSIAVRILSYEDEPVGADLFRRRIRSALDLRRRSIDNALTDSYRLVNGEGDGLSGLIADKYADTLVLQFHTRGIERYRDDIVSAFMDELKPRVIVERSDVAVRNEGAKRIIHGPEPGLVEIRENGLGFLVDPVEGQKTGFFLDQRDKRAALMKYSHGADVLNCFSYTGGFTVYALKAGARRVTSVDSSRRALDMLVRNAGLNGFDPGETVDADVKRYIQSAGQHDVIILDPPAFVKDRARKASGLSAYRAINELAIAALRPGGVLLTCSCSSHVSLVDFLHLVTEAAARARRSAQVIETYTHGLDHPVPPAFVEGQYLKAVFVRVGWDEV